MVEPITLQDVVVSLERAGERFYRSLAERVREPRVREILLFLADDEDAHARFWEALSDPSWRSTAESPFGDAGALLSMIHSEEEADELAEEIASEEEALDVAIRSEESSIRFYTAVLEQVTDQEYAADLSRIIREEEGHRDRLLMLKNLSGASDPEAITDPEEIDRQLRQAVAEDEARRVGC